MHSTLSFAGAAALLIAPAILSQDPSRSPRPGAPLVPIHTAAAEQDGTPYGIWAAGRDYKVSFHDGFAFTPYLGDTVRENVTVRWRTLSATAGGIAVADVTLAPSTTYSAFRFEYRFDGMTEAYDVRAEGVEQTFVIAERPAADGDLVIAGLLYGSLALPPGMPAAHGSLSLADAGDRALVQYGAAFAVDARGERLPLVTEVAGRTVTLRVPAAWLRAAAFPLTIDPVVKSTLRSEAQAVGFAHTDVGRDDRANHRLVAYARKASASDSDLFLDLCDDSFALLATVFTDISTNWSNPRAAIAFVGGPDRWVTALERQFQDGRSGIRVNVRDSGSLATDNAVTIFHLPVGESHSHPDVGGSASGSPGDNALVVFQQLTSGATKHEVQGVVYDAANRAFGTPRVMAPTAHGTRFDRRAPAVNQESFDPNDGWVVAYQEQDGNIGNDDVDVLYVRVGNDGALLSSARGVAAFEAEPAHKLGPKVAGRSGKYLLASTIDESASRPAVPASADGTALVLETVLWPAASSTPTKVDVLRRHVRTSRQWVVDGVAFDTRTRTFWAVAFHNVVTGDCSISRHGFDAGEVDKEFLAEPGLGERGFGASVCFDDDAGTFVATLVRERAAQSELVGTVLSFSATAPVPFGTSCGGRVGSSGTPLAGSDSFGITLSQATPNAPAVLLLGTSPANLPLAGLGMAGCFLNVTLAGAPTVPLSTSASGSGELPLPLPANPVALTGRLVVQFVYLAPGQNALGVLATGGLDVVIAR